MPYRGRMGGDHREPEAVMPTIPALEAEADPTYREGFLSALACNERFTGQ